MFKHYSQRSTASLFKEDICWWLTGICHFLNDCISITLSLIAWPEWECTEDRAKRQPFGGSVMLAHIAGKRREVILLLSTGEKHLACCVQCCAPQDKRVIWTYWSKSSIGPQRWLLDRHIWQMRRGWESWDYNLGRRRLRRILPSTIVSWCGV